VTVPALADGELEALLRLGESDRTERKRNIADIDRIREAICAFANDLAIMHLTTPVGLCR
jgi:hypothetical protein